MGYRDIELWHFHLHQKWWTSEHVQIMQDELQKRSVQVVAFCGGAGDDPAKVERCLELVKALNIRIFAGASKVFSEQRAEFVQKFHDHDMIFAYENHPEPDPQAVFDKIGPEDADVVGLTIDTGWFGTQGFPADQAVRELIPRLKHLHLKDMFHVGTPHDTCGYGQGAVPLQQVVQALADIGYDGYISVEHEPEQFDPTDDLTKASAQLDGWLKEVQA